MASVIKMNKMRIIDKEIEIRTQTQAMMYTGLDWLLVLMSKFSADVNANLLMLLENLGS